MTGKEFFDGTDKARRIIRDFEIYESSRANWDTHWEDLSAVCAPLHYREFNSRGLGGANYTRGDKRNQNIYDSTAPLAATRFASIVDSLLTPSGRKYQQLVPSDPELKKDRAVRLWFEELTNALFKYRYFPKSNFSSQNFETYFSMGVYGTGCTFIDHIPMGVPLRYKSVHLSQLYIANNDWGIVDKAFRVFPMRLKELYDRWGDGLPEQMKSKLHTSPTQEFTILHLVEKNMEHDPEKLDSHAYTSDYVSVDFRMMLESGGYHSFPYVVSRYRTSPGEVYGRSPAMDVLPAMRTLNAQKKTIIKQGQRAVDQIYLTHDDGVLDGWSMLPGQIHPGTVTADGRALVHALPPGNINVGMELIEDERETINDAFYIKLFQILVETPQMTATEVLERVKEKGNLLLPTVGRQESEYLSTMTEREIDILVRNHLVPEKPGILNEASGDYDIVYDTPMTKVRRSEEVAGALRTLDYFLNYSVNSQNPASLDWFDIDGLVPFISDTYGMPLKYIRAKETVQRIREERARMRQQQQESQNAQGQASVIKAAAAMQKAGGGNET